MKIKCYKVLQLAIREGALYGVNRYYKHRDTCPPERECEVMAEHITEQIMIEICEWFDFEEDE